MRMKHTHTTEVGKWIEDKDNHLGVLLPLLLQAVHDGVVEKGPIVDLVWEHWVRAPDPRYGRQLRWRAATVTVHHIILTAVIDLLLPDAIPPEPLPDLYLVVTPSVALRNAYSGFRQPVLTITVLVAARAAPEGLFFCAKTLPPLDHCRT